MPIVINPDLINPAALTVPAVYLVTEPPQASITGAPASVIGQVGTASWGPVNKAVLVGSLQTENIQFGPISVASLTDIHDLPTDTWAAFQQASALGLSCQQVRVTDGTDAAADLDLVDNQGNATVVAITGTKTTGDTLSLTFTNAAITGNPVVVPYVVLSTDTLTTIATAFKNAINNNVNLQAAGISATASGTNLTVRSNIQNIIPVITNSSTGSPTEILTPTAGTAVAGGTLNALWTGILGNSIKMSILPGTSSGFVNVLLTAWAGKAQEFYMGLPNNSTFWARLAAVLSGGAGPTTPASNLARFVPAGSGSPQAPQMLSAIPLSGGLDGRSGVTSADLIGSPTGGANGQGSGLYALLPAKPFIQQAWCVGLTDLTVAPSLQTFAQQYGVMVVMAQDINTDVTTAVSNLNQYGIDNYEVTCVIDWPKMFDPVNNVARYVAPQGPLGGLMAALAPQNSPLNKQLQGVISTARLDTVGPYDDADIGLANTNGVALISNPIPAGPQFGFVTAVNTSLNNIGTAPIEYTRMTNFLQQSIGAQLGIYLGLNQSQQPVDPVRSSIKSTLNSFLASLEGSGINQQLDAHLVLCEFQASGDPAPGYNTPTTIGQHICSVFVAATYLSSIWYLIFTLQGGTTVSVQNVVSPQPASS